MGLRTGRARPVSMFMVIAAKQPMEKWVRVDVIEGIRTVFRLVAGISGCRECDIGGADGNRRLRD